MKSLSVPDRRHTTRADFIAKNFVPMPAVPWKLRQRQSRHSRLDRLSFENERLKREVERTYVDTLREIRRRIESDDQLTLRGLQKELTERIAQVTEDSAEPLAVGGECSSLNL